MRNPTRSARLVLALAAALACASTHLSSVYVNPDYRGGPFERVMIVGLAPTEGGRVQYENTFVQELAAHGVQGIASASVFPAKEALTRETVGAWVRERGIRGVLVTRVADVKREQRYVPPTTSWDLYGYYGYWGPAVVSPGYIVNETTVVLETNLFDADTGTLVYTAVSETFQPESRTAIIEEVVKALTHDLEKRGLLQR